MEWPCGGMRAVIGKIALADAVFDPRQISYKVFWNG